MALCSTLSTSSGLHLHIFYFFCYSCTNNILNIIQRKVTYNMINLIKKKNCTFYRNNEILYIIILAKLSSFARNSYNGRLKLFLIVNSVKRQSESMYFRNFHYLNFGQKVPGLRGGASGYDFPRCCWYKDTLKFIKNKKSHEHTPYLNLNLRKVTVLLLTLGVKFSKYDTKYTSILLIALIKYI